MRALISFELLEKDGWTWHDVPRDIAKEVVRDMVRQMSDESWGWFLLNLTVHQLDDLAEAVRREMREREHGPSWARDVKVHSLGEL